MTSRECVKSGVDLTPEHTKRRTPDDAPLHSDIVSAGDYVDYVVHTSDFKNAYAWHGWALREAFLAGVSHAQEKQG